MIRLITLDRVKLRCAVTFMKYLASVVSLIFLAKTLIRTKITFLRSNSLNLAGLVVNEPMNNIYKKNLPTFLFPFDLLLFNVKTLRAHK